MVFPLLPKIFYEIHIILQKHKETSILSAQQNEIFRWISSYNKTNFAEVLNNATANFSDEVSRLISVKKSSLILFQVLNLCPSQKYQPNRSYIKELWLYRNSI